VPPLPRRHDRAVGSDAAAVLPLQGTGLRDRLSGGQIHRRRRGALPPALRAARVARRDGTDTGVGDGRAVRAPDGPLAPAGLVAARRELTFLLAEPERRLLRGIATRLPRWVTSDGLTALGVVGALGTGAAYALSTLSVAWLWAASAMLVVQWFGDSLDGTVARVRRTERPRYGYYLDHIVDAFSTAAIGAGIGLSPYVNLGVALAGVLAYLILSINIYLESQAFGVFRLGYSQIGPTEARIVLVAANVALALSGPGAAVVPVATGAAAALAVGMFVMVAVRIGRNLSALGRLEPPPTASPPHDLTTTSPEGYLLKHEAVRPI